MLRRQLVLAIIGVSIFTGCADLLAPVPDPTKFYLLAAIPPTAQETTAGDSQLSIGIGPLSVPDYVDRPEIVIRTSPTQVRHSIVDQWAEPLGRNVTRVLSENIALLLGTTNVVAFPSFEVTATDYQVTVTFIALEQDSKHTAHLSARWEILHPTSKQLLVSRFTALTQAPEGDDIGAGVVALSNALGEFSRQIATALQSLPPSPVRATRTGEG